MSKNKPARQQVTIQRTTAFMGPLPPPEVLERYEELQPGFANRLLTLTEDEALHRRGQEKRIVWMNFSLSTLGLVSALASVGGVLWLCYYAFERGFEDASKTIAISVLIGIAGVFLFRTRGSKKE